MKSRIRQIFGRYGNRTLVVVLALAGARIRVLIGTLLLSWVRLSTLGEKGRGIHWGRDVSYNPGGHLDLGDNLFIGDRCGFEIGTNPKAQISIGTNTWISHSSFLSSRQKISIGQQVLIGEFVSIRDSTHSHADLKVPMKSQQDILGSIRIEDDVWIGRGCLLLGTPEGVIIGRGSIIAANSVVSRSIPPMQIWGGAPARFIKTREAI
jgi:acetyltransferase-like isoleucine patch superfamily enzyme